MGDVKKFKIPVSILLIFILLLYVGATMGTFISLLISSSTVQLVLYHLFQSFNYIGFGFNETIALLIIPASILLIINVKKIDIDKGFVICRILSFISFLITLFSLFIPFLTYLIWLAGQSGVTGEIWGTIIPIFAIFLIELLLNLIVLLFLIIKHD